APSFAASSVPALSHFWHSIIGKLTHNDPVRMGYSPQAFDLTIGLRVGSGAGSGLPSIMKFVVGPTRPGPLCALLLFSAFALNSCSVHGASREYEIKAVLLFNLARFVDWPPGAFSGPDSPIFIGIMGRDP